jgi:hypothetical protein
MQKGKPQKKDITLMTLLAYESTPDARRLLKKYGYPDAKSYGDLEIKLAELYYAIPDKLSFEKELAEIHPHKNWILRNSSHKNCECDECKTNRQQKEENKQPIAPPTVAQIDGLKSNADGSQEQNSSNKGNEMMSNLIAMSGIVFAGAMVLAIVTITMKSIKD